jgi:hypothetical protein
MDFWWLSCLVYFSWFIALVCICWKPRSFFEVFTIGICFPVTLFMAVTPWMLFGRTLDYGILNIFSWDGYAYFVHFLLLVALTG